MSLVSTGEGVSIVLARSTFNLTRLSLRRLVEFEQWCRQKIITSAKESLPGLPPEVQGKVMSNAIQDSNKCGLGTPLGMSMFNSIEGRMYLLYLSAKNHPDHIDLRFDKFQDAADIMDQDAVLAAIAAIGGMTSADVSPQMKQESPKV